MSMSAKPSGRAEFPARRPAAFALATRALVALLSLPCGAVLAAAPDQHGAPSPLPGLSGGPAKSENAAYETLFGAEERRVAATPTTKDDAKFAAELIEKVKSVADEPGLVRVMYEKAFEYGAKDADGYEAALTAAHELEAKGVGTRAEWRGKLINLHQAQLRRAGGTQRSEVGEALVALLLEDAEELSAHQKNAEALKRYREAASVASSVRSPQTDRINQTIKDLQSRQQILERADKLQAQLDQNPLDANLRGQLINLFVTMLDDPAGARKFATARGDEELRNMLALAAGDPKQLNEEQCLKLGRWYKRFADKAEAPGKAVALARSLSYYNQFLEAHAAKDALRLRVQGEAEEVDKLLAAVAEGAIADRIVIWNQHNGPGNDRGATAINVILLKRGRAVWEQQGIAIPWEAGKDLSVTLSPPRVPFDRVRVEVIKWKGSGGGLAEVQVFHGATNLAEGANVTASGSLGPDNAAKNLTDGVTNSAAYGKGFWLLPSNQPGWAEVEIKPGGVVKGQER